MKIFVWLLLCLIWGTTWIFIKIGLQDLPPITFAVARFLLAVILLVPIIAIWKLPIPKTSREWRLIALTGYGQESDRKKTRDAGFQHHLVKPVDLEAIEAVLGEV